MINVTESIVRLFRHWFRGLVHRISGRVNQQPTVKEAEMGVDLKEFDISHELWREYEWEGRATPYRINNPVLLFIRPGGTTHRVVDYQGVVHCVPSVGVMGCVLRWKNPDGTPPVNF